MQNINRMNDMLVFCLLCSNQPTVVHSVSQSAFPFLLPHYLRCIYRCLLPQPWARNYFKLDDLSNWVTSCQSYLTRQNRTKHMHPGACGVCDVTWKGVVCRVQGLKREGMDSWGPKGGRKATRKQTTTALQQSKCFEQRAHVHVCTPSGGVCLSFTSASCPLRWGLKSSLLKMSCCVATWECLSMVGPYVPAITIISPCVLVALVAPHSPRGRGSVDANVREFALTGT